MKSLYRFLFTTTAMVLILVNFVVISSAQTTDSVLDYFGAFELFEALPDETIDIFEQIGIETIDFDSVFNVNAGDVWSAVKRLISGSVQSPLETFVRLIAVIVLVAVFDCFISYDGKIRIITQIAGVMLCLISIANPLMSVINSAAVSVNVSADFMLVLIPVITSVLSVSGNPILATSFRTVALGIAQIISAVTSKFLMPVIGVVLGLDMTCGFLYEFKLNGITSLIKKFITAVISFTSTLFVSFLGLKGGLANAADNFTGKSIKLVVSSAVPVVGGALSEAYSGVLGSILLVKSTISVLGIAAITLINLPSCIQLLFWIFTLRFSAAIADLFRQAKISEMLRSLSSSLVLLNVIIVFIAVLFIISVALILMLRTR